MRNRIIGLGIFAIVFSLNLFFSGTNGLPQAQTETSFSQPGNSQQHDLSNSGDEIRYLDGILQQQTEIIEQHQLIRKYPATLGVLFLLLNENAEEKSDNFLAAGLSFTSFKDIPVTFHNLRI